MTCISSVSIKDTVPIAPKTFQIPPATTIKDALNKKFANKLIPDHGLALSVYDILTAEDGRVTWGNGQMYYKVSLRLLLFAPFPGEVLIGRVHSTSQSYIRISLGFFRDIYVLPALLPPNSGYDPDQNRFFWYADAEEGVIMTQEELLNTTMHTRLYIDIGEPFRFRVDSIEWQESEPIHPSIRDRPKPENGEVEAEKDPYQVAGYKILATIADSGLGVVSWWGGEEEGEVGEEGVEEEEDQEGDDQMKEE